MMRFSRINSTTILWPYYYLFFKLNRLFNKKENNIWGVIYAQSFLIYINVILIYISVFHVTRYNFHLGHKAIVIVLGIVIFLVNLILFLPKNRHQKLVRDFEEKSTLGKKLGNFIIILYISITIILIFLV
jgi:hypothetical protein